MFSSSLLLLLLSLIILLLFSSSSKISALETIDDRDAWPPIAPRINATVSPFLVWTYDWTVVGCSFFACFGGLSNGHMAALTIQRFRALRQPIAQQCTWKKQFDALISTNYSTSILDRADTPTGLSIEVEGGKAERFLVGAFWFNLMLGVGVLLLQFAIAHGLERYMVYKETGSMHSNGFKKKEEETAANNNEVATTATTTTDGAKKPLVVVSKDSYEMEDHRTQFLYVATKWGFGRVLTGVIVLPFYSAFRLAMIVVSNGESSSAVMLQARVAIAVHLICIAIWMLIAPSMASRRCFAQSRFNETKSQQKKSFLAWLLEDKVRWRFEKMDDFKAMVVVASIENVNKEERWWVVPLELFVTIAIDLGPMATTNPNDDSSACFTNNLTGLIITTLLWWFILYLRPFQRRLQHMCWFIQLSMQNFSYLFGVLQEQQTAPVPKKREIFIILCFIACFTSVLVTFLFTFLPLIRKIVDKVSDARARGANMKSILSFGAWEQDFLSMLQQDQAVRRSLMGGGGGGGPHTNGGGGLDEELLMAIHGMNDNSNNNNNGTDDVDDELAKFLRGDETERNNTRAINSLALPSQEYSPAALKGNNNNNNNLNGSSTPQRNVPFQNISNNTSTTIPNASAAVGFFTKDEDDFLNDFLGTTTTNNTNIKQNNNNNSPGTPTIITNNNSNNKNGDDETSTPPPPPPPQNENDNNNEVPPPPPPPPPADEGEPDENGYYYDEQGNPYYYEEVQDDNNNNGAEKPNLDWL